MKRLFKWIGLVAGVAVILLLAAAVILPLVFDPNDHKDRIEQQASAALGRVVHLEGPIGWSVFPWLAIDLNDVTVANESGFQQALLMRVARASARVRVMPLLRGVVEIGTIGLEKPEVNLEVAANGRNNWESLGRSDGGEDGGFDGNLAVAGVRIDRGRVHYQDRAGDVEATISDLSLSTGSIDPGQPVEAATEFDLELPAAAVTGRLLARATIRGLLSDSALDARLERLELNATAGRVPLQIELAEAAELDGAGDTFSAPAVTIESAGATLRTNLSATELSGDMKLSGHLEGSGINARRWLTEALEQDPGSSDPAALTELSLAADWTSQGDRATLKNLDASLDDSKIQGEFILSSLESLRGRFKLHLDRIDLDRYLPAAPPAEAGDEDLLAGLRFGNLTGQLTIDELKFAGMTASKLEVAVESGSEGIDFDPITADFYGGKLDSAVALRPGAQRRTVHLRQQLNGVQGGPLFEDLFGRKVLTGLGNLSADISLDRPLAANPLASASGRLAYDFEDGQLFGVNVFGIARQALAVVGRAEPEEDTDEEDTDEEPATDFSSMILSAVIANGVLETRELSLRSPVLEMSGRVTVNLADRSLRGTISPALQAAGARAHGLKLGSLAGVPLPVSLAGTVEAPRLALDPAQLLLAAQRGRLDDKKADLLDRLSGRADEKDRQAKADRTPAEESPSESDSQDEQQAEEEPSSRERAARGLLNSLLKKGESDDEEETEKEDGDSG